MRINLVWIPNNLVLEQDIQLLLSSDVNKLYREINASGCSSSCAQWSQYQRQSPRLKKGSPCEGFDILERFCPRGFALYRRRSFKACGAIGTCSELLLLPLGLFSRALGAYGDISACQEAKKTTSTNMSRWQRRSLLLRSMLYCTDSTGREQWKDLPRSFAVGREEFPP
jgi:hypothetical protein